MRSFTDKTFDGLIATLGNSPERFFFKRRDSASMVLRSGASTLNIMTGRARGCVTARQGIADCRGNFRARRAICEDIRGAGPLQSLAEERTAASRNQGSRQVSCKWIGV